MKKIIVYFSALLIALSTPAALMAQHQHNPHRPHVENNHRPHQDPSMHRHHPHHQPCATAEQMTLVVNTLQNISFDDKRLEIAQLCVVIGSFCTDDLARMAQTFSFDNNRLEFLKFAYPYCIDPERYPTLHDCFTFDSNYKALMDHLYPRQ